MDDLLRALRSPEAVTRHAARCELLSCSVHPGGGRYRSSRPLARALLAALPDPALPDRPELLALLARLVIGVPHGCWWGGNDVFEARRALVRLDRTVLPPAAEPLGALEDVQASLSALLTLYADRDPAVRAGAVAIGGLLPEARNELAPAARRMLLSDPDVVAATAAALSLGMLCAGRGRDEDIAVLRQTGLEASPVCVAAAVARVWHGDVGGDVLETLNRALKGGGLILDAFPWPDGDLAPFVVTALERATSSNGRLETAHLGAILAMARGGPVGRRRLAVRTALAHAFPGGGGGTPRRGSFDNHADTVLSALAQDPAWWDREATPELIACDLPDTQDVLARLGLPNDRRGLYRLVGHDRSFGDGAARDGWAADAVSAERSRTRRLRRRAS